MRHIFCEHKLHGKTQHNIFMISYSIATLCDLISSGLEICEPSRESNLSTLEPLPTFVFASFSSVLCSAGFLEIHSYTRKLFNGLEALDMS